MKTINALQTGLKRTVKAWKGILIVWFISLAYFALLMVPVHGALKAGFGSSMITEKLLNGINVEVLSDLGPVFNVVSSSFFSGLFLSMLIFIIINAFLSGGLFNSLKDNSSGFSAPEFFRASARYFWPFLVITGIISIVAILLALFIVLLPAGLVAQAEPDSEKVIFLTGIIASVAYIIILLILMLVADYARAWSVAKDSRSCFRGIGFALGRTFERFRSSFLLILIMTIMQVIFGLLVLNLVGLWKPVTGAGVFLLFLVSQFLFIIRILLRVWRYGGVTHLMDLNYSVKPIEIKSEINVLSHEKTDNT